MGQPHKVMRKQKINSHYLSLKIDRRKAIQKVEPERSAFLTSKIIDKGLK